MARRLALAFVIVLALSAPIASAAPDVDLDGPKHIAPLSGYPEPAKSTKKARKFNRAVERNVAHALAQLDGPTDQIELPDGSVMGEIVASDKAWAAYEKMAESAKMPLDRFAKSRNLLTVRFEAPPANTDPAPAVDGFRIAKNPPQTCSDMRGAYIPGVTKGLIFHSWLFRVNLGFASNLEWYSTGGATATNVPERLVFETVGAGQDWMASRNPSPGNAPLRYDGNPNYAGCSAAWPQGGDGSGQTSNNTGRLRIQYLGDTNARASLLANCQIGNPTTPAGQMGVADGISAVVAGQFHDTAHPSGGTCASRAVAASQIVITDQGFIVEGDMSYDAREAWCYRFTTGCHSSGFVNSALHPLPMEDTNRHEQGHIVGLHHTCFPNNCSPASANLMTTDDGPGGVFTNGELWPHDIAGGDRLWEVFMYTIN